MESFAIKSPSSRAKKFGESLPKKDSVVDDVFSGVKGSPEKTKKKKSKGRNKSGKPVSDGENSTNPTKKPKKGNPYTVFVGNISYKTTKEEINKHFEKAGEVVDVRLPKQKGTDKLKGFAYVEVKDRITYEKALAMHHTHLHGRQINVEYTTQGKKGGPKEEKIKQKNLKLRALSKTGILFPREELKGKKKVKPKSAWEVEGEEQKSDKMAISSAKRARNTSEGGEKSAKKKKQQQNSELMNKSVSSPKLTPNKKGAQANAAQLKAVQNTPGSGKKAQKLAMAKGVDKSQASSKGKTGKKSKKAATEGDSDEEDDDEEENDDADEMQAEESDEEAGEEEESDEEEENAGEMEQEAEEGSESDDDEAEGAEEAGGNDKDDASEDEDNESDSDSDDGPPKKTKKKESRESDGSEEHVAFVSNIPYSAGQDEMKKFFGAAGTVTSVRIPIDNKSGRPRGFGFVTFEDEEGLKAALELDGEEMGGRALKVMMSHNSGGGGDRREGGFRGGRGGFRGGDRRGGSFRGGSRGGGFRGDRRGGGGGGGGGGFRGGRGGSFRGDRRGGGRGFGGGDKFGGGGGRSFRGGSSSGGKPWKKDGGDKPQKQTWSDSD